MMENRKKLLQKLHRFLVESILSIKDPDKLLVAVSALMASKKQHRIFEEYKNNEPKL